MTFKQMIGYIKPTLFLCVYCYLHLPCNGWEVGKVVALVCNQQLSHSPGGDSVKVFSSQASSGYLFADLLIDNVILGVKKH